MLALKNRLFLHAVVFLLLAAFFSTASQAQTIHVPNAAGGKNAGNSTAANQSKTAFNASQELLAANASLAKANESILALKSQGIPTQHVTDLYSEAVQVFEAQSTLEKAVGKADYSIISQKTLEIEGIKERALRAHDELGVLNAKLTEVVGSLKEKDKSQVLSLYNKANDEFKSERFDKSLEYSSQTYDKIIEAQAFQTTATAIVDSAAQTVEDFLRKNFQSILVILGGAGIVLVLFNRQLRLLVLKRKLEKLGIRKKSLKELLAKTQREYFEQGTLDEGTYRIRIKKFGELVRDIDRQTPLVLEEIEKAKTGI